jgi:hypothetical protein
MLEYNTTLTESQPVLQLQREMFNKRKRFKSKKKFDKKDEHNSSSTFDSKVHHKSNRSSGYGMKHGVEQDPAELHGSSLQGMLDKWNSKN